MIAQDSIESLKTQIDIVELISRYVELKKSGSNFMGLCPFHGEKTPSFLVTPARGSYHCFGCGVHGDGIRFVMEFEKLSYPEAIEKIAEMHNFSLRYEQGTEAKKPPSKLLEEINEFYRKRLLCQPEAVAYLRGRGMHESMMERFELGYAPVGGETLQLLKSQFANMADAAELGIVGMDQGRIYARLFERITFPIRNHAGKLVGFGGRTLGSHPAKYLNSPETPLFKKSQLLYGYHLAKEAIHHKNEIIITEGYLDVILLHQAGFPQSVAVLGTSLTKEHLPLLRKGAPKIVMAYDGDRAGREKLLQAARLLSLAGLSGGVALLEEGKDPADMVVAHKIEQLKQLFSRPKPFIPFCLEQIAYQYDIRQPEQKERALLEAQGYLKELSPLLQEEYRPYLASLLKISLGLIKTPRQIRVHDPLRFTSKTDAAELAILKTIAHTPELTDMVLEYLDATAFEVHGREFLAMVAGEMDDPGVAAILYNDTIRAYEERELKEQLLVLLIRHHTRELERIRKDGELNFERKSFLLRNCRLKIERLRRGELVPYESTGTF